MRRKKLARQLQSQFGTIPDHTYFEEDMLGLKTYYDHRKGRALDPFLLDNTTWHDLSMDSVFKRINATQSTSGEQYLYYTLRCPAMDPAEYHRREGLIALMEAEPGLRLKLQVILARLGKRRAANTSDAFSPPAHTSHLSMVICAMLLGLLGSAIGALFSSAFIPFLILFLIANPIFHTVTVQKLEASLDTVNYSVSMLRAAHHIEKLHISALTPPLARMYEAVRRARRIRRIGGVSLVASSDFVSIMNLFLMTDLITFERLKRNLGKYHQDIFCVHEHLGRLDTAIAVASFRKSIPQYCLPTLDFEAATAPCLRIEDMVHPLLRAPIANSVDTGAPLLITGSNASGKSTFLKAVVINAILAQSICTALAAAYRGTAFRMYTSMAIADNVLSGESYFIAEIKSIKRIVDAAAQGHRILCAIDEVLRGTNTVERIAASSELLKALGQGATLCLAATHDGELCAMLKDTYRLAHFEERIEKGEILFDYRLKEGPATTRNAIQLLEIMGFDPKIVAKAREKAKDYLQKGQWHS